MSEKFFIRSQKIVFPDRQVRPALVVVTDGKISDIRGFADEPAGLSGIEAGDSYLMPSLVDTHVHINEPGRTEWEGFETATSAAAAGGISVVVDMPLNSIPPTVDQEALEKKMAAARGHCTIDYGFWGGVIPGNADKLEAMIDAGALGFKAFLIDSGVDEFPMVRENDLRLAMPILASRGVPLLVHAEVDCGVSTEPKDPRAYQTYLESRPQKWEVEAIRMMIRLARETGCHVHIVHLSAADALNDLRKARAEGVKITAETCPHYLFFKSETIPDGATQFKCAPPIRETENRDRLWRALNESEIDFIVSDHSPCTPQLKKFASGDFEKAWGGISGLQFSLSVTWTAARARGMKPERLVELMCVRTAEFVGQKSGIAVGNWANLVLWNPDESFQVNESMIRHRHHVTPYAGETLYGVVEKNFLRGHLVYDGSTSLTDRKIGRQIKREKEVEL